MFKVPITDKSHTVSFICAHPRVDNIIFSASTLRVSIKLGRYDYRDSVFMQAEFKVDDVIITTSCLFVKCEMRL